jgi:uncharacterized delta-60 repeat protein
MLSVQRSRRSYRPAVEQLEGRLLLSAGDLDPTFGTGGKLTTGFISSLDSTPGATAVQADAKIVVAGQASAGNNFSLALARYNPDGTLDPSFGAGGRVLTPFGPANRIEPSAVAVQPDAKIVVAGSLGGDFLVARYNVDGTLDTGFGTNGLVTTDFGGTVGRAESLLVQPDRKILVVGNAGTLSVNADVAMVRYNPDGSLDTGFGSGGKVAPFAANDAAYAGVLQPDGKILVAGSLQQEHPGPGPYPPFSTSEFSLRRYNADGSADTSFGFQGLVTTAFASTPDDAAQAIALQPNGMIVLVGTTFVNSSGNIKPALGLARYTAAGQLDPGFGTGGTTITDLGGAINGIGGPVVEGNGRIVVSALTTSVVLVGYTSAGTVDSAFGVNGKVTTPLHSAGPGTLAADGDHLVAVGVSPGPDTNDFGVVRYLGAGSPDATFGTGGTVTTEFTGPVDATATAAARQSDGKLVVVGTMLSGHVAFFALVRYNPDGSLDTGFGNGGRVTTHFASGSVDQSQAVVVQTDGKLVVAGSSTTGGQQQSALARYLPDGRLDPAFGNSGEVLTSFGGDSDAATIFGNNFNAATSLALAPNGELIVGGTRTIMRSFVGVVVRYKPDGSVDFGPVATSLTSVVSVAVQADGRIVAAGGTGAGPSTLPFGFAVARLNADGTTDTSFGTNGVTSTAFGNGTTGQVSAVTLQADGRIVVAGTVLDGITGLPPIEWAVARYLPDGQADSSFGSIGRSEFTLASAPPVEFEPVAVGVQPNGLIGVAGTAGSNSDDFVLATLYPDGSLDPAFGTGGLVTTDFAGGADTASAILLQPDSKPLVAGTATVGVVQSFAVARYQADTTSPVVPVYDTVRFADAVYQDVLGRAPSPAEAQAFEVPLDAVRFPVLTPVALAYVTSTEERGRVIGGYYQHYLGRPASPGEVQLWLPPQQNLAPDQALPLILGSAEYFQKHGGNNASWLAAVYQDLLGRAPDPGSQPLLDALNQGTPREQIAALIAASPEYRSDLIVQLYATDLGRGAAASEVALWLPVLSQPAPSGGGPSPAEQFRAALLSSPEYFHSHGNTNQGWVDSLYTHLLGRLPDEPGLATTLQAVLNGYVAQRQATARALLASTEYQRDLVTSYYTRFLHRSPAPAEVDGWVQVLQQGGTDEQVLALIVSSDEYYQLAGGTDVMWLDQIYQDLLGRTRNPFGDNTLLGAIQPPGSRLLVANAVLTSTEYREDLTEMFYMTYLGRPAPSAEIAIWLPFLQQGGSDEDMRAAILGSPEYFVRPRQLS